MGLSAKQVTGTSGRPRSSPLDQGVTNLFKSVDRTDSFSGLCKTRGIASSMKIGNTCQATWLVASKRCCPCENTGMDGCQAGMLLALVGGWKRDPKIVVRCWSQFSSAT